MIEQTINLLKRRKQENQNMNEICARCGKETEYEINTPLEVRRWYVEGGGADV